MDDLTYDLCQLSDEFHNVEQHELSLEGLLEAADITIGCHKDIMQLKKSITTLDRPNVLFNQPQGSSSGVFIDASSGSEATIIISQEILMAVFSSDTNVIGNLIKQLDELTTDSTLNVIFELGMNDLNYVVMEAGIFISNLIKQSKCIKVFNFGSQASIADLMIAMCCDEVYVSNFASVSITKADNGSNISRFMVPVYEYLIKVTYAYWTKLGLFTQEEVTGLFESEADNSIQLLSPEIKKRLSHKAV